MRQRAKNFVMELAEARHHIEGAGPLTDAERDTLLWELDRLRADVVRCGPVSLPRAKEPKEAREVLFRAGVGDPDRFSENALSEVHQLCAMRDVLLNVHQMLGLELGQDIYATIDRLRYSDMYEIVRLFNNMVVGPEVDRTEMGPSWPERDAELTLGIRLLVEEVEETVAACGHFIDVTEDGDTVIIKGSSRRSLEQALDGYCDIQYVLHGLMLRLGFSGILLHEAFTEVTRANMDKAGGPLRDDGKRLKPEGWVPPQLAPILERHMRPQAAPAPADQPPLGRSFDWLIVDDVIPE